MNRAMDVQSDQGSSAFQIIIFLMVIFISRFMKKNRAQAMQCSHFVLKMVLEIFKGVRRSDVDCT